MSSKAQLMEEIVRLVELAYNPQRQPRERELGLESLENLLKSTKTLALIPVLTALVQQDSVHQAWMRPRLLRALAIIPLRPLGVRHTIEFVLSIHPSTKLQSKTTSESRGPNISLEALNSASKLISAPPSGYDASEWFNGIAPQLFALLDGEGDLEMVKAASFIIGYGILGRKEYGAPGAAGWNAFVEPLTRPINPIGPIVDTIFLKGDIEDIRLRNVIVTSSQLAEALRRLASLLSSHPNPGLSKRILTRLLLPLWSISSWPAKDSEDEDWRAPAGYLLQILIRLSDDTKFLGIAENLTYNGNRDAGKVNWRYVSASNGGIEIESLRPDEQPTIEDDNSNDRRIDMKVDAFITLLQLSHDIDPVPGVFLTLCRKWLHIETKPAAAASIMILPPRGDSFPEPQISLAEGKIVQRMMEDLPERLIGDSTQVLELASDVLERVCSSKEDPMADETVPVALSLLSMVFTSHNFDYKKHLEAVYSIRRSLTYITEHTSDDPTTARNLLTLLSFKSLEPAQAPSEPTDKDFEDRKSYKLALSYLTSTDSPTPVRAQGLSLLSALIQSQSSILNIPATLILLTSLLQDEDEYIYLRTIKALTYLSIKHPRSVLESLLESYVDGQENLDLDARLKVGEALLQVIEKAGQTFTGAIAHSVGEGLLSVAGRRGYRPKTELKQRKEANLQKAKNQEAEEAWEGPVPQLEKELENEVLTAIVDGWSSKRGSEDLRIRASALSILGVAIETNVSGIGSEMVSTAIDLSINILAMESEPAAAILRRSAIMLIMSLIRALDSAAAAGKNPGFGFAGQSLEDVLRILEYVRDTDGDGLVVQHAKDVIEGLETWRVKSLLPRQAQGGELETMAGLSIEQGGLRGLDVGTGRRPRIEEVE